MNTGELSIVAICCTLAIAAVLCTLVIRYLTRMDKHQRPACANHPDRTEHVYVVYDDFKGSLCEECYAKRLTKAKRLIKNA